MYQTPCDFRIAYDMGRGYLRGADTEKYNYSYLISFHHKISLFLLFLKIIHFFKPYTKYWDDDYLFRSLFFAGALEWGFILVSGAICHELFNPLNTGTEMKDEMAGLPILRLLWHGQGRPLKTSNINFRTTKVALPSEPFSLQSMGIRHILGICMI
jgi:hypothetical protein